MTDFVLDEQQAAAEAWFRSLRDRICAAFEAIEDDAGEDEAHAVPLLPNAPAAPGRFVRTAWDRANPDGSPGGGGVMGVMKGRVFEKVGVNISTVHGEFSPEFAKNMNGAEEDPRFFATGISLVAHMANPHVPAVHMNTRFLNTTRRWFGGGADLNPALPRDDDTAAFKAELKVACDAHDPEHWERFSKWCDEYFWVPHRNRHRGVGGIFYDHLEGDFDSNFAFTRDVGEAFLRAFPAIVRARMGMPWSEDERDVLLRYRGVYAEFNLVHDRGTLFGLKTGGNIDAILMSLPPEARWA
ncbi:oxygen-dependent coproporphyrinogen oxidase [Sandaracinobacteroides saxicola]|uniref:coproporphyrinogen oxidase n=1 Tax=Sandaracinobacteroides saxicola TaxID=2759707 RepID=A0A7G5IL04_9SPHN|nr:oxygen-dependent coproporphyrinogen oxidase [Sandaracinobacteroides saxicola]QMW24046.1 oxygen-dependent coproporphyrinogen oxidase [Sandaracinobacteroides saxicola]